MQAGLERKAVWTEMETLGVGCQVGWFMRRARLAQSKPDDANQAPVLRCTFVHDLKHPADSQTVSEWSQIASKLEPSDAFDNPKRTLPSLSEVKLSDLLPGK
jgi:hypothetical protein